MKGSSQSSTVAQQAFGLTPTTLDVPPIALTALFQSIYTNTKTLPNGQTVSVPTGEEASSSEIFVVKDLGREWRRIGTH